jgi:hypothetical protein
MWYAIYSYCLPLWVVQTAILTNVSAETLGMGLRTTGLEVPFFGEVRHCNTDRQLCNSD